MNRPAQRPAGRRIVWINVLTVISAAILIGAEVFGAAFAGGWAFASWFDGFGLGEWGIRGMFLVAGLAVTAAGWTLADRRKRGDWAAPALRAAAVIAGLAVFAVSWALPSWFTTVLALRVVFFLIGMVVMASFIRAARRVEPFTEA